MSKPIAYRLEWKPGDYCYYLPAEYEREVNRGSARIRGLYRSPRPGYEQSPDVYHGTHFVRPNALRGGIVPAGFRPLYLGHIIHEPR